MATLEDVLEGVEADTSALKLMRRKPRIWAAFLLDVREKATAAAGGLPVALRARGHIDRDSGRPRVRLLLGVDGASPTEIARIMDNMSDALLTSQDWTKRTGEGFVFGTFVRSDTHLDTGGTLTLDRSTPLGT